jgi:hypothetical protein
MAEPAASATARNAAPIHGLEAARRHGTPRAMRTIPLGRPLRSFTSNILQDGK